MARIAEDLLLLLLDNESAQPRLNRNQRGRALAAALLLDLAYDCRIRPAVAGDATVPGQLIALAGPVPMDPAVRPALGLLERSPLTAGAAIGRLRKRAEDDVLDQLLRTGQIHQIQLSSHRLLRNSYAWPLSDHRRVGAVRQAITSALFHGVQAPAPTAAIVAVLSAVGGLGPALNLDEDAAKHAAHRASEVTFGVRSSSSQESPAADVNLAATAAAVLPALN